MYRTIALSIFVGTTSAFAGQIPATWNAGAATSDYGTAGNWDIGVVPLNAADTYAVTIPGGLAGGSSVDYALSGAIDTLDLDADASLDIAAAASLTVTGATSIDGNLTADGASSTFSATTATFGDEATLVALNGASLTLGFPSIDYRGPSGTFIRSDEPGSMIDLSSVLTITGPTTGAPGAGTYTIEASDNATIDLSGLTTADGGTGFADRVRFRTLRGGAIDLSSLTSVTGHVWLDLDDAPLTLANLTSITGEDNRITVGEGGSLALPQVTEIIDAEIELEPNATLIATFTQADGTAFDIDSTTFVLDDPDYEFLGSSGSILTARGDGLLDLSATTSLVGPVGNQVGAATYTVEARDQGMVDLSGVVSIQGPAGAGDRIRLRTADTGSIDISNLASADKGLWIDSGTVGMTVPNLASLTGAENRIEVRNNASLSLPSLTELIDADVIIGDNATLNATFNDIDGSTITVGAGSTYAVPVTDYTWTRNGAVPVLFEADGANALLDLSNITLLTGATTNAIGAPTWRIGARNGGEIDLSSLTEIRGPVGDGDRIAIDVESGGRIRMNLLETIVSSVRFEIDDPNFVLPNLDSITGPQMQVFLAPNARLALPAVQTLQDAEIELDTNSDFDVILTNYDGTSIAITDTVWSAPATTYEQTTARSGNLFVADGPTATLDLSFLTSFIGFRGNAVGAPEFDIAARNGGDLFLSSLEVLAGAASASDRVVISASAGGFVDIGNAELSDGLRFEAHGAGSIVRTDGNLRLVGEGGLVLTTDGLIQYNGELSYITTDASEMDGSGGTLEVGGTGTFRFEIGGEDLGASGATTGNFGIGHLIVGRDTDAPTIEIVDCIDNGNRVSNQQEALYLYGISGGDGLSVRNGATLVIANFNVYARIGGTMTNLQDLFSTDDVIAFDGGFLSREILLTPGDVDGDRDVDLTDLSQLLANFGIPSGANQTDGDFDGDGDVDLSDLAILLGAFGTACE